MLHDFKRSHVNWRFLERLYRDPNNLVIALRLIHD